MANDWISKFKICLQSAGVGALRPLSDLIIAEPSRVVYKPFTTVVGKNGVGRNVPMGFPVISWAWDWLPQNDIEQLRQFEEQDVYIETETDSGVSREFKIFAAYAQPFVLGDAERRIARDGADAFREKRALTMEFGAPVAQ